MAVRKWWLGMVVAAVGLAGCHLVAGLGDVDEVSVTGGGGNGGIGAQGGGGQGVGNMGGFGGGVCDDAACNAMDQECLDFSCEMGTSHCDMGVAVAEGQPCLMTTADVCDSQGACVNDQCLNMALDTSKGETDVDCGGMECSPCENTKICDVATDCRSNNCMGGGAGGGGPMGTCEPCTDGGGECSNGTYCDDENADAAEQICKDEKHPGGFCTLAEECVGGFCTDGVCCDNACGATDCESCLGADTGGVDGICGFVTAGTDPDGDCTENISGNAVNGCEGNACSGTSAACAPTSAAVECRVSGGACDVAESCDGSSLGCPQDSVAPAGTVCGAGMTCDGTSKVCQ